MIGTKLAHYEITSHLGTGGMGEVYQATDLKLGRSVAIKILPEAFTHDADRATRLEREARVLASLNHPNIATIHGVEESGGRKFLVMELVTGETLAEKIKRGAIPVQESLGIATQICDALEAAHEKGVIHRDLKPANIKITAEGKVKVLDFGLAKAFEGEAPNASLSNSPTMIGTSLAATQQGIILGTAAYMSPEQAKGRAVDKRADIWAFGVVLYEMLAGRQAFEGEDVADLLVAVLSKDVDWTALPAGTPPAINALLRRCLVRDPKNRLRDIGDARLMLSEASVVEDAGARNELLKRPTWKQAIAMIAMLLLGATLAGVVVWKLRPRTTLPVTRFAVTLAQGQQFQNLGPMLIAISPDGSQMVYTTSQGSYHRAMSETEARPIPGTEQWQPVLNPVFSPDGRDIVFIAGSERTVKKIAVTGGAAVTLFSLANSNNFSGMSWGAGGIVFAQADGIYRVSADGGNPELLVKPETGEVLAVPQILPGGDAVLYTAVKGFGVEGKPQIVVQSLKPGSPRETIVQAGAAAHYVSTGHIVYALGGTLFAVPFDLGSLKIAGGPVPVVEGVLQNPSVQFSVSDTGSLIYVPGPASPANVATQRSLAALSRQSGPAEPAGTAGVELLKFPPKGYAFVRVAPDGKHAAVSTDEANDTNVWIVDLTGAAAPRQLTLVGANRYPVWSPDGEWVAFQSDREGDHAIFRQKADGTTGVAERLTKPEKGTDDIPDSWSPDGKWLAYTAIKGNEGAVWILSLPDKKATAFAEKAGARIARAAFSPDGHWLAYQSFDVLPGRTVAGATPPDVFVQPFPSTGAKYLVVKSAGHPMWSPDGRELIVNPGPNKMGFVSIATRPAFSFGEPSIRDISGFGSTSPNSFPRRWDIAPDGKRIIGVAGTAVASRGQVFADATEIRVVLNWFEELNRLAPAKK